MCSCGSRNTHRRLYIDRDILLVLYICARPEALPSTRKHLIEVIFEPPDIRRQASKLPYPIDLPIPMLISTVRMSLDCHR